MSVELFNQIKKAQDDFNTEFEGFKATHKLSLAEKADGKAVADFKATLDKIQGVLDVKSAKLDEMQEAWLKATSPGNDSKSDKEFGEEVKSFNLMMRSEFQSKGKAIPAEFDADGYKAYKSGFFNMVAGVPLDQLDSSERKAMIAGSDPDGGYLLPHSTTGITQKKLWEQSIMRQIATVQSIGTEKIEGLIDNDEADAGWVAEIGARTDSGTPQVGKWEIAAHELYAMPKISQKLLDDAAINVEAWLAAKVADKFARVEGNAFWNGTGIGQPRGLATYTTVATADETRAWGQFEYIATGASGAFHTTKMDPLHTLQGAFKDQYLNGAQFVMRREARTALRLMKEATNDRYLWEPSNQVGQPDRLNGYPVRIDQYMPAIAANSLSVAFGDFKEAYLIVDRIGMRTLRDPYTAKPYVVFYTTKRTGGGAMNTEAVKFLKFASS